MMAEVIQTFTLSGMPQSLLLVISVGFLAPFTEELIFRGLILRTVQRYRDVTRAVVFAGLLFAVIHFNPYWMIQLLVLGVWCGYWVYRFNSILVGWFLHTGNNLFALYTVNNRGGAFEEMYLWGDFVHPIVMVIAILMMFWAIRWFKVGENAMEVEKNRG